MEIHLTTSIKWIWISISFHFVLNSIENLKSFNDVDFSLSTWKKRWFYEKNHHLKLFFIHLKPTRNAFQFDLKNIKGTFVLNPFQCSTIWERTHFSREVKDDMWMKSHFIGATYNPCDFHDIVWKGDGKRLEKVSLGIFLPSSTRLKCYLGGSVDSKGR